VTTIMPYTAQITELLQRFREGHREDVFFGLLEMDREALPELMGAFRVERDVQVRAFIVEIIWQRRQQSVVPFLGEALRDSEPAVWREALDGLVALASPAAWEILRSARTRQFPNPRERDEFRRWLDEAISQAAVRIPSG
jgi:hypothetical protein